MKSWRTVLILGMLALGFVACKSGDSDGGSGGGGGAPAIPDPKCDQQTSSSTCTDANCSWTGTRCAGSYAYCSKFSTSAACPGNNCQWSSSGSSCQPPATSTTPTDPCSQYSSNPTMCAQIAGCVYSGNTCMSSSSTGGATTGMTSGMTSGATTGMTTGTDPNPTPNGDCEAAGLLKCYLVQGCKIAYLPFPPKCASK